MAHQPRAQIEDIIQELRNWLPNYDSKSPNDYPILLFRILASLPGGDELEDMGYETFNVGWHEADQLGRVLEAIQDKQDVEDLVHGLVYEEEEDVGEARRRRPSTRERSVAEEWWIMWDSGEPEGPFERQEDAEGWASVRRKRGRGSYAIQRCEPAQRPVGRPPKTRRSAPRKKARVAPRKKATRSAPRKKTRGRGRGR